MRGAKDMRLPQDPKHQPDKPMVRRRWRLEEQPAASGPRRRWFATLAGLVAVALIWRGTSLLMDLYVFLAAPGLSSFVSIGADILLLFAAGLSLEDAT